MRRHKRWEAPTGVATVVLVATLVCTHWLELACLLLAVGTYVVCAVLFAAVELYGVPFVRHLIGLLDDRRRDRELAQAMEHEATARLQLQLYVWNSARGPLYVVTKHGRHAHNGPSAA